MLFRILIPSDKAKVIDYISRLSDTKQYTCEVKVLRQKRSHDQNKWYWSCIACISSETGNDKDFVHEYLKNKYLPKNEKIIFGEVVSVSPSTAKLDTAAFSTYMERIIQFASTDLGIVLPKPEDRYYEEFIAHYRNYI